MSGHFRRRYIGDAARRYVAVELPGSKFTVRNAETGQLIDEVYDSRILAETKCRDLLAIDVERLFMPDEVTALARVATIISEQSDPQWAARMIVDYFAGAKA